MPKNIIFCADGTWNGPGEPDTDDKAGPPTNVFKLFLNLDGKDTPGSYLLEKEQERTLPGADGAVRQTAKYLHGVGDSDNFLVRLLGGTLGAGLIARIVRGYTFISRNYVPGDKVFITGFSRGAYTARALGGMIANKGILDPTRIDLSDKERAYKLGTAVWYEYRRAVMEADSNWLEKLEDTVLDIPGVHQTAERKSADAGCDRSDCGLGYSWGPRNPSLHKDLDPHRRLQVCRFDFEPGSATWHSCHRCR